MKSPEAENIVRNNVYSISYSDFGIMQCENNKYLVQNLVTVDCPGGLNALSCCCYAVCNVLLKLLQLCTTPTRG